MAKVIVGIGMAGVGKTTVLKTFAEKNGYAYICPDDIRAEVTGNAMDQSRNKEIWDEVRARTAHYLQDGQTVVVDATFTTLDQRIHFLDFVREHGAEKIQGIFVDAPAEIAKERNASRERRIPEYAIDRMAKNLKEHPPKIEDGFDSIFTVDEYQQLKEAEMIGEGEFHKKKFK
jgi:predicted kinase